MSRKPKDKPIEERLAEIMAQLIREGKYTFASKLADLMGEEKDRKATGLVGNE